MHDGAGEPCETAAHIGLLVAVHAVPRSRLRLQADNDELARREQRDELVGVDGVVRGPERQDLRAEYRALLHRCRRALRGVLAEDPQRVGSLDEEHLTERVVEREAGLVGGDDGCVARADESERSDARAGDVPFFAARGDGGEGGREDGASGLLRASKVVQVDVARLVPDCDERVVVRQRERRDGAGIR